MHMLCAAVVGDLLFHLLHGPLCELPKIDSWTKFDISHGYSLYPGPLSALMLHIILSEYTLNPDIRKVMYGQGR